MTEETARVPFDITIRRDGRVVLSHRMHAVGRPRGRRASLLLGEVRKLDTHDGPAWFWSVDSFDDDVNGGHRTRGDAVLALLADLEVRAKR